MKNTRQALREFGASFMGPAFLVYAKAVEAHGAGRVPVCLAREGWCFERLLSRLQAQGLLTFEHAPRYLKVSRTLLFRANLGEDFLWPLALGNDFEGGMLDLMRKRFGLQMHEAFSVLPVELLQMHVKLPEQQEEVVKWLAPHLERLKALVAPTQQGVMAYLKSLGLTDGPAPIMFARPTDCITWRRNLARASRVGRQPIWLVFSVKVSAGAKATRCWIVRYCLNH